MLPWHLQVEQVGTVLGVVEGEGHGLVDRHGHGARGRVGIIAAVDGDGFEFPLRIVWHVALFFSWMGCGNTVASETLARGRVRQEMISHKHMHPMPV
jgi:hypothetical protein